MYACTTYLVVSPRIKVVSQAAEGQGVDTPCVTSKSLPSHSRLRWLAQGVKERFEGHKRVTPSLTAPLPVNQELRHGLHTLRPEFHCQNQDVTTSPPGLNIRCENWRTYCDIFKKKSRHQRKTPSVCCLTVCRRKLKKKIWLILWNMAYPSEQIEDTVMAWPNAELRREMAILRLIFSVVQLWGLWGLWGGEKMVKKIALVWWADSSSSSHTAAAATHQQGRRGKSF